VWRKKYLVAAISRKKGTELSLTRQNEKSKRFLFRVLLCGVQEGQEEKVMKCVEGNEGFL
jgi:hypothetical protein